MRSTYVGLFLASLCIFATQVNRSSPSPQPTSQASASTAIVGATLVDVRNGKEIENSVLVIRGERIIEVGVSGKIQAPTDARIVDAHGRWIIPGLIDMHVHLWDADLLPLSLFLANGITTIRDPGDSVLIMRLTQDEITSGKRISPRLFFCGDLGRNTSSISGKHSAGGYP
jgi:hypothetical protein